MDGNLAALRTSGFAVIDGAFTCARDALEHAQCLIGRWHRDNDPVPLEVVGDFVLPPLSGQASRDFQTLHLDFGLPIDPEAGCDVGLYTALYVADIGQRVAAQTRFVTLAGLFGQRAWPPQEQLVARLIAYGRTHGARDDADGYVEGSLARIVEAAAGPPPMLPSVKLDPGFLCGLEFDSLSAEVSFFRRHGLDVGAVETSVELPPGGLLVFDNLAVAHGRRGTRQPGELHQRVVGHRALSRTAQLKIRDTVLGVFSQSP